MRKFSDQVKVVQTILEELNEFQYNNFDECDSPFEIMGFEIKHVGITFNFVNLGGCDELNVFIPNHILRGNTTQELVDAFLQTLKDYDIYATPRLEGSTTRYDYLDHHELLLANKYDELVNSTEEDSDDSSECDCPECQQYKTDSESFDEPEEEDENDEELSTMDKFIMAAILASLKR